MDPEAEPVEETCLETAGGDQPPASEYIVSVCFFLIFFINILFQLVNSRFTSVFFVAPTWCITIVSKYVIDIQ